MLILAYRERTYASSACFEPFISRGSENSSCFGLAREFAYILKFVGKRLCLQLGLGTY